VRSRSLSGVRKKVAVLMPSGAKKVLAMWSSYRSPAIFSTRYAATAGLAFEYE
jgi:hypothetical protein